MVRSNEKLNRKAQEFSMDLLIKILLALLVLVVVFMFLFGNQIWDYVRNLPGNKYNDKDPPVKNITKDDLILASYFKVAVVLEGKYIKLCTKGDCNSLRESKLYLYGDDRKGEVYTDINWAFDKRIGSILNSRLVIDQNIFAGQGVYNGVKNELPSYSDLKNLDNSLYISGTFYRDKEYVPAEGERIFGTQFTYMEKDNSSFGSILKTASIGDEVIVNFEKEFKTLKSGTILLNIPTSVISSQIRVVRKSEIEFTFYVYYTQNEKQYYEELDCNKAGWVGRGLSLEKIRENLAQTLADNCNDNLRA